MAQRFQQRPQHSCLQLTRQLLEQTDIEGVLACLTQHAMEHALPYFFTITVPSFEGGLCAYQAETDGRCGVIAETERLANGPYRIITTNHQPLSLDAASFRRRYPALAPFLNCHDFTHFLGLPILDNDSVIATCSILRNDGKTFSDEEIGYLQMVCEAIAIAASQMKTASSLQQQQTLMSKEHDEFHVLVNVTNAVLSQLDLHEIIERISDEIHHYFNIDAISLIIPDQKNDTLNQFHHFFEGEDNHVIRQQINSADTLAQHVLSSGQMLHTNISTDDSTADMQPLFEHWQQNEFLVYLYPLKFGGSLQGVMQLALPQKTPLPPEDVRLLGQIAERTAIAVGNARAYREIAELKEALEHENHYLNQQIKTLSQNQFDEIIGNSKSLASVLQQIEIVAATDCTVLLLGDTGTGKELFARAIHKLSPRADKQMIKMNCAAMPAGLLESDLFGHDKGAFTGATRDRQGRFEMANHSTLFLDEVGDMPVELQPKLLRVLQEQEFEHLGGNRLIHVDVRLIAATNRDLKQMVTDKEFRSDLYYRLNVFPIRLPPLSERREDIPALVKFFVFRACQHLERRIDSIPADVIHTLQEMEWAGNVRELENFIERAVLLSRGHVLQLPPGLDAVMPQPRSQAPVTEASAEDEGDEYQEIIHALLETNGIVAGPRGAAQRLGLKRTTLLSRMKKLGIDKNEVLAGD